MLELLTKSEYHCYSNSDCDPENWTCDPEDSGCEPALCSPETEPPDLYCDPSDD